MIYQYLTLTLIPTLYTNILKHWGLTLEVKKDKTLVSNVGVIIMFRSPATGFSDQDDDLYDGTDALIEVSYFKVLTIEVFAWKLIFLRFFFHSIFKKC